MSEHIEVETKDLQEAIDELDDERRERKEEEAKSGWIRYIGLSTAFLAVFAAIGALQSGNLVNEAMLHQIQASDTWAEYQASRGKDHLYTVMLNNLVDANANNAAVIDAVTKPREEAPAEKPANAEKPPAAAERPAKSKKTEIAFAAKPAALRAAEYREKVFEEMSKEDDRSAEAKRLEEDSAIEINKHHHFEYSVAIIQVAIAVGAVSALTRVKSVWFLSLFAGAVGIVLFVMGFLV
ncbi:MAG TPA: DUF4337 domain-containing protein [Candidatus Acidoferrales bacterium]|jgi:hypothetical protein|nr:DUF4337 domain-containing protein [Candidatus Acidoferrales bacterium]